MNIRRGFALGFVMMLLVATGFLGYVASTHWRSRAATHEAHAKTASYEPSPDFSVLATRVEPSVVNITAVTATKQNPSNLFGELFRGHSLLSPLEFEPELQKNLGSGFIIDSGGYILTNSHIVDDAAKIIVRLSDHRSVEAVIIGTDPKTDLAVLKARTHDLPALKMENSDTIAVGDWVAAFGSPFGLDQSMTAGIISAKGRTGGSDHLNDFLQTDAIIDAGNSGGPLVNLQGKVVGVTTSSANPGRGINGIGFAIPAATAWKVYEQLLKTGAVTRGWIGTQIQEVTPEIARSFGLPIRSGALVSDVLPGGPAERSGIRSGDIIVEFNHQRVPTAHALAAAVANAPIGITALLQVFRDGSEFSTNVLVGERPSAIAGIFRSPQARERGGVGLTIETVTPEIQATMHLVTSRGVLVLEVTPGSLADVAGVIPGDIICAINHIPLNGASDLTSVLNRMKEDSTILFMIERNGKRIYLAFELNS